MSQYTFRTRKLRPLSECLVSGSTKFCVVLVMCGSFNPIHSGHLSLFDAARKKIETNEGCVVIGGYISPVSDAYAKQGLAPFPARKRIIEAAVAHHKYLELDDWEALQPSYTRTYLVLRHLQENVRRFYQQSDSQNLSTLVNAGGMINVVFTCGTDLFTSFFTPKVWPLNFLQILLDEFAIVVIERLSEDAEVDEKTLRKKMNECTMTEVIDGREYKLSFQRARIEFCPLDPPDSTSSTLIRSFVKRSYGGDITAHQELYTRLGMGVANIVLEVY